MKIQIIMGSTRQNRFSEKPARWLFELAKTRTDFEFELLDLRDYPLPFYDEALPPAMLKGNYSSEIAKRWANKIGEGDGYIIVTPEYNHGYPGVLKNALDTVAVEWGKKPVGFVSYGSAMGTRSVQQLRQVAIELRLVPIEAALQVPIDIFRAGLAQKEGDFNALFEPMKPFANTFLDQMAWWTKALQSVR
ncbi:MAG: NAD(P)H-dependent oxidoreductase [Candidatus Margulisiibacteriota bacterium]